MLCILAPSLSFREACRHLNDRDWASLEANINENADSLEIFAKSRGLDWTAALEYKSIHPNSRLSRIALGERWPYFYFRHPHEVFVPIASHQNIRLPRFQGYVRSNISESTYRPEDFIGPARPRNWPENRAYPSDPTLRNDPDELCHLCRHPRCNCHPFSSNVVSHPLVELRQYPGKGIGVRTLQEIHRGDILEEYAGQILPVTNEDHVYSVSFHPPGADSRNEFGEISAMVKGNWTRFVNHSCSASLSFETMAIGERYRVMVVAERDIEAFSELTIDYGPGYWLTLVPGEVEQFCLCGQPNCKYSSPKLKNLARREGSWKLDK